MFRREDIERLMAPFDYKSMERKSAVELYQAVILILCLDEELEIIEGDREEPDILLQGREKEKIGLEVTTIRKKSTNLILQSIFNNIREIFEKTDVETKGFFSFYITINFPSEPTRAEREIITKQTIEYLNKVIKIELDNDSDFFKNPIFKILTEEDSKPNFIEKIAFSTASKLEFFFNEGVTTSSPLEDEEPLTAALINAIRKKERRLKTYTENTNTANQWLLIINEGVSSESYDTEVFKDSAAKIETDFEKVFLLTEFDNQVITIK